MKYCILYQIFKIISSVSSKTFVTNPRLKIYINNIEKRITFKIKTGYYFELLTPETLKL